MALEFLNDAYFAAKVGIGTDSPVSIVDIFSTAPTLTIGGVAVNQVESGRIRFTEDASTADFQGSYIHYDGSANKMHIGVHETANDSVSNDLNAITIRRVNGYVGIGNVSPGYRLSVNGTIQSDLIRAYTYPTNSFLDFDDDQTASANHTRLASVGRIAYLADTNANEPAANPAHEFFTGTSDIDTATSLMIIETSGNVGIGTTNPENLLHIKAADGVTGVLKIEGGKNTVTSVGEINSQLDFGSNDASVWSSGNVGGRIASVTETSNGAYTGMAFYTFTQGASSPDTLSEKLRITHAGGISFGSGAAYGTSGQVLTSAGNASPTWTTPTTGTVTGTGVAGEVAYWTSSTNIANNAGMSFSNEQLQLDGIGGADGFALPYDENPGYSNMSAGGFGILFREARDNYITGNAYWYKTGGTASWRAKYGADAATMIGSDAGNITFETAPANTTSPHTLTFSPKMVIKNGGNVGIGVTSPVSPLSIQANSGGSALRFIGRSDGIAGIDFFNSTQTVGNYFQSNGTWIRSRADGGFHFSKGSTPITTEVDGFTIEGMNVGIGTASPTRKLSVENSSSSIVADFKYSAAGYSSIDLSNNVSFARLSSVNSDLLLSPAGSEKMRVTSSGNVGIGTTSPNEKLDVAGNIKIQAALLSNQDNTDVDTGTETVANVAIATYTAAFFDFVIKKGTNVRSGTVYACHDGTNVEFTETSTQDLGDTSDVTLSVDISGGNMRLRATTTSDDWSVKSLIRAI